MAGTGDQGAGPRDPLEMFRRLWGPLGVPVPGLAMPTLDPQEIDKRIQELKSVDAWLTMNQNMLRTAIQALEMQKAGLQHMQGMQDAMQKAMQQMADAAKAPSAGAEGKKAR